MFPGTTLHMECLFMKVNHVTPFVLELELIISSDVWYTIMDLPKHHGKVAPPGNKKIKFKCIDA